MRDTKDPWAKHQEVREAESRGQRDYRRGIPFSNNPYRHYTNTEGCVRLMSWWEAGWLKEQLKVESPEKYGELLKTKGAHARHH